MTAEREFSDELDDWLRGDTPKTLGDLGQAFSEKSFAVTILLLMFVPALPLPTGGITHVFEVITVFVALQMVIGRRTIWLPRRWQRRELGTRITGKAVPFIIRRVRWFERFTRPRADGLSVMLAARDAGITFLDDARYDDETGSAPIRTGYSEVLFGELFRQAGWPRDETVVANKLWWEFWPRQNAADELDASLARMRFDHVDLIYANPP